MCRCECRRRANSRPVTAAAARAWRAISSSQRRFRLEKNARLEDLLSRFQNPLHFCDKGAAAAAVAMSAAFTLGAEQLASSVVRHYGFTESAQVLDWWLNRPWFHFLEKLGGVFPEKGLVGRTWQDIREPLSGAPANHKTPRTTPGSPNGPDSQICFSETKFQLFDY